VDPIALIPQQHFGKLTWHHEEELVKRHLAKISAGNRSALAAPPFDIIARMLRGRSSLPRAELRMLVDRYIAPEQERRDLFDKIAADKLVINLAPSMERITRMTTRATHQVFNRVYRIIDEVTGESDSGHRETDKLHVVVGSQVTNITDRIADFCQNLTEIQRARSGAVMISLVNSFPIVSLSAIASAKKSRMLASPL
jgi:hypothetical protein